MKVQTLVGLLNEWADEGLSESEELARLTARYGDATVLLPDECPDCGGSGEVYRASVAGVGMDLPRGIPCPTCHGKRKAVIVPKEQWEAFEDVCRDEWVTLTDECGKRFNRATAAIATALLGGKVYRASVAGVGMDLPRGIPCPTCEGKRKAVIVPKEQWEAARRIVKAWIRRFRRDSETAHERDVDEVTAAIATALLGGKVYRATAVVKGEVSWSTVPCGKKNPVFYVDEQHDGFLISTPVATVGECAALAILEKEDGE